MKTVRARVPQPEVSQQQPRLQIQTLVNIIYLNTSISWQVF